MSAPGGLEDGYRRLLAWYPRSFRRDQGDELLAVLMAGAEPGQRRPRLTEAADLLSSAARLRLGRAMRPGRASQRWAQALAVFGVIAPLFLVIVAVLEVAVPYHLPAPNHAFLYFRGLGRAPESGGPSLLRDPFLDVVIGIQVLVAALALLGRRRLALIAMLAPVGYWVAYWVQDRSVIWFSVPDALLLLTVGGYLAGGAALLVSPDSRPGYRLLTWRHWAVLVPAAALVQVTTLMLVARSGAMLFFYLGPPSITGYLVASAALAALTLVLAVVLRLSWSFLLLLAALCYPYAMELASSAAVIRDGSPAGLLSVPTPGHLAVLLVPPVLVACAVLLIAAWPRRSPGTIFARRQA